MRFATFTVETAVGTVDRAGLKHGDRLVDLTAGYATLLAAEGRTRPVEAARALVPPDMLELLRNGTAAVEAAREVRGAVTDGTLPETGPHGGRVSYEERAVSLRAPLPRPNTVRDFSVFEDHGGEKPDEWYDMPAYYKGNPDSTVPPNSEVEWPDYTDRLDFELELGVVVGQECRDIDADEAEEYIAGYTVFNDFSARDIQSKEMTMGLGPGKGKDFANGFGPYLVTADAFDPGDARMTARVNGEVWCEGNSGEAHHSVGDMLAHAAMGETLSPGDVLGTGTVGGGCGYDLDRWVDHGDTVELEVEGIGVLRHTVT